MGSGRIWAAKRFAKATHHEENPKALVCSSVYCLRHRAGNVCTYAPRTGTVSGADGGINSVPRCARFWLAIQCRRLAGATARLRPWSDPAHPYVSNAESGRTGGQPTLRIGDARDPILKPWAAQQMLASNEELLSGIRQSPFSAQARCFPGGVPGQLLFPFAPLYFMQTPKEVWMMWQRDHMWRRVRLAEKHSADVKPSWFGESIGHYENGDTLVIDTIGLSTKNSYIDNFRTPHSEKLHMVERFTLSEDGNSLTAIVTVEDPDTFNAPLTMQQRWFKQELSMKEIICAENNRDFENQIVFPMPEDHTPDF